jgi:hypothetical protein
MAIFSTIDVFIDTMEDTFDLFIQFRTIRDNQDTSIVDMLYEAINKKAIACTKRLRAAEAAPGTEARAFLFMGIPLYMLKATI